MRRLIIIAAILAIITSAYLLVVHIINSPPTADIPIGSITGAPIATGESSFIPAGKTQAVKWRAELHTGVFPHLKDYSDVMVFTVGANHYCFFGHLEEGKFMHAISPKTLPCSPKTIYDPRGFMTYFEVKGSTIELDPSEAMFLPGE